MGVKEKCGRVAKNRVVLISGGVFFLCARHFSNQDIQRLVTRKWVRREYLENGDAECQAEVEGEEIS